MKRLFEIAVAIDEKTGLYTAVAQCTVDGQVSRNDGLDLRRVMSNVSKSLRKKERQMNIRRLPGPISVEPQGFFTRVSLWLRSLKGCA